MHKRLKCEKPTPIYYIYSQGELNMTV